MHRCYATGFRKWGKRAKPLICRAVVGLERVMGIEPTCEAWKASVLPLNYTRVQRNSNRMPRIVNVTERRDRIWKARIWKGMDFRGG